jgi:uncharacterized protein
VSIPSYWRSRQQRLGLVGEVCPTCEARLFPPRDVCPHCGGPAKTRFDLCGRGVVYSFSKVNAAPEGFEAYAPYVVALVKLEEGPLVTAQLTDVDPDQVHIGMPVEMVTRQMRQDGAAGLVHYSYKFRPLLERVQG